MKPESWVQQQGGDEKIEKQKSHWENRKVRCFQ